MTPTAMAIAVAAPLMLAEGEPRLFDDIIGEMVISRAEAKTEWPFSIDEGELSCVVYGGQRNVFFSEILTLEEMGEIGNMTLSRSVVVTTNPFALFATIEDRELYAPYDSLETLITRLAPYETMGFAICPDEKDA